MRYAHLAFGLGLFIVLTVTGSYMRADFPDKDAIPQDLRLLMRSRHIYILFSALIHLALGIYFSLRPGLLQRVLQISGSFTLFVTSGLLVWAWYAETYQTHQFTDLSCNGIYLSLAGIGLHLLGGIGRSRER